MSTETPDLVLTAPAEAERIAVVRRAIGGLARVYGADEELVDDILTAVSEGCTNAVLHAYHGQPGLVRVEVRYSEPCLQIRIRDWGSGMEPEVQGVEASSLRLGISLMSALADEMQVRSGSAFGTEVVLIFDLDREPDDPEPFEETEEEAGLTVIDADGPGGLAALKSALTMAAAQANFSLDKLSDLQLLAEVLLQDHPEGGQPPIRVAISELEHGLELAMGPVSGHEGLMRLVERLAESSRTVAREDGEHLEVTVGRR